MTNLEAKTLSAVLNDKQIHVLMQANASVLMRTHGDIYEFIETYYDQNRTVPPVDIVLKRFPDLDYDEQTGSTRHHLDELRIEFLNDSMKMMLRAASQQIKDDKPVEAMHTVISEISNIQRITSTARDLDVMDTESAVEYFENIARLQALGNYGIYTGLKGFDAYLPAGITPGMFGIFLAYPAIGKSWMMLYFAVQAWLHGKSPLIISLEMSEEEVRNRLFTILGGGLWSHRKLAGGHVEIDMFRKWAEKTFTGKPPIHIISNEGIGEITPSVIAGKIGQYSPDIVFIDYINLMSPNGNSSGDNETVRMKKLSRELKLLAGSEHVPVVAISSATPDDNTDMSTVPELFQVSWSKQLAYDSDWLLALGRAQNSDVIECVFRKNRNGPLADFLVQVDFDSGRFVYKEIP